MTDTKSERKFGCSVCKDGLYLKRNGRRTDIVPCPACKRRYPNVANREASADVQLANVLAKGVTVVSRAVRRGPSK